MPNQSPVTTHPVFAIACPTCNGCGEFEKMGTMILSGQFVPNNRTENCVHEVSRSEDCFGSEEHADASEQLFSIQAAFWTIGYALRPDNKARERNEKSNAFLLENESTKDRIWLDWSERSGWRLDGYSDDTDINAIRNVLEPLNLTISL